jgi:hypothetical protein
MAEPVCKLIRYPPALFLEKLRPYEEVYKNVQSILFYRRPIHFGVLLAIIELFFLFVGSKDLGILAVLSLVLAIYYIGRIVVAIVGADVIAARVFGPFDEGNAPTSNRIYPLLPFCQRISHISSTIGDAMEDVCKANCAGSISSLAISAVVSSVLYLVFSTVGSFWPAFVLVHLVVLAPGIVMHPKVFPYTEPYILKFAKAINCPYCQAKTD